MRSLGWQPGTWSDRVHNPFLLRMSEMKKPLWPADYFYVGNDGLSISNPGHTISNLTLRQRRQKDNLFEVLKTFSSSQTNLFSFNTNFSCLTVTFLHSCKLQIQTINFASVYSRKLHAISTWFRLANVVWQWIYLINWLARQNGLLGGIQSGFNFKYFQTKL